MTFDFDDHCQDNDALPWLFRLKEIRDDFKCTLFAIPGLGSDEFWEQTPEWVELAVHGWTHPNPYECSRWSYGRMAACVDEPVVQRYFVQGWKSPGWQISDDSYRVLLDRGWWVADQHLEDGRRPAGLRTYFYEDGNWHGHVQNVCGNGIEETWPRLVEAVESAPSFEFASDNLK